jgi:hypothetical protein
MVSSGLLRRENLKSYKNKIVAKINKEPGNWTDSLDERPELKKTT